MVRLRFQTAVSIALTLLGAGGAIADSGAQNSPNSGLAISGSATLKPGIYTLNDSGKGIVQITGRDFTVDFKGAKMIGPGKNKGIGIAIADARNVTIKNADVTGCLWGIVVERSQNVKLLNCVTSHNANLLPGTVIDESGTGPEDNHGGGILLRDSKDCLIQKCVSQYQWDGIDVIRSERNTIEDGDFSYNNNWGIHFWDSSNNTFQRNRAVWCTTGGGDLFQALTGWQTYDAQAVGIDHNSNANTIAENDLRFGGDGIFIRANEGPITPGTAVPPRNGSHRNILRNNDCSFSPNNAIEVDLVDDTIIEGNNCSYSHYGMWLGYSRRCQIRNNICIADTAHAVEIENGQNDVFENNVFGFDAPRPDVALVYLRQNGRDATPSGPYTLRGNVFYGSTQGVLLKATKAEAVNNTLLWGGDGESKLISGDAASGFTANGSVLRAPDTDVPTPSLRKPDDLGKITPGSLVKWNVTPRRIGNAPPVVEIDGIPVWTRTLTDSSITFWMPADLWDRPTKEAVHLTIPTDPMHEANALLNWPANLPRVVNISPNPAKVGDVITILGPNISGGRVLFNGKSAPVTVLASDHLETRLPEPIVTTARYNVIVEKGTGTDVQRTAPIVFSVQIPDQQLPHLVSASFSPTTLHVGDILHVTFTVKNNLPTPAPLMPTPGEGFTYDEKQSWEDLGIVEAPNTLHLRVTSDHPGAHESGSWPFMFGFGKATLTPNETIIVTGNIKVLTPGEHEFRVGLVATGVRFIDDNAFRTKITVLP